MTTPALRVDPIQDPPPINLVETTVDDLITPAEPMLCFHSGYSAGALWSTSQTKQPAGYEFFRDWWKLNREKLGADALQQAAAHLLQMPKITTQESLNFWNMICSMLPPADQSEATMFFLDGFRWGCRDGFEKALELRRQAFEKQRLNR
jgi:hypothetical protein